MSLANRRYYPVDMIASVLAEERKHRYSDAAWEAYIHSVKSGPTLDILVYGAIMGPDPDMLSRIFMAPLSDDVGEALGEALAEVEATSVTFDEPDDGPTTVTISAGQWEGEATVAHVFDEQHDHHYAMTERAGEYDDYDSIRARAVCLAILMIYSPTEDELNAGRILA